MTRAALLIAAVLVAGCSSPFGMIPGGRLDGDLAAGPVEDWSLTDELDNIQLETRPDDPYSVNLWCVAKGPALWVSAGSPSNTWAKNLLADPRARVRVGDRIFERRAVRVTDPAEVELVFSLYGAKYDRERDLDDASDTMQFRLDPR